MQDRIEKEIVVKAPVERVWTALTDHREFGTWFRVRLEGPFGVGQVTRGAIMEPGYEGWPFWAIVRVMDAPRHFAFDWPSLPDARPEDAAKPGVTTRVEFRLDPVAGGTRIRLSESGFASLPSGLALTKLRDNDGGWAIQIGRIKAHVDG